jgi:adenine-specific DNA-methyltransferase
VDNEGHKFSNNTETDGRFHSKWMNMMYPRLYLARNLLNDEGVIFVSIDDSELCNLRSLMNEIFGEKCFVSVIIVQANKRGQTYKEIAKTHEYLVVYSKNPDIVLYELEKNGEALPYSDSKGPFDLWELRNRNPKFGRFNRPNLFFPIYVAPSITDENGYSKIALERHGDYSVEVWPRNSEGEDGCWRWGKDKLGAEDLTGTCPVAVAKQKRDGGWNIYERSRKSTTKAKSLWTESEVISEQGTIELGELGLAEYFEHPKPVELLKKCIRIGANSTDLVLDFFAGSGTTAQAVFEVNSDAKSNLRFLLVQLPEPTNIKEFPTIADITKERVRRVIHRHEKEAEGKLKLANKPTEGFRVMKLTTSNFKVWNAGTDTATPETLGQQLELHISHVQAGRSSEDLLTEILFKNSFPLTTPVQSITVEGIAVYSVANGAMLICLEKALTHEAIKGMAELKPERVVCLDEGFAGNDQLKTNAVLMMKAKGVTKFQTV